MRVQWTLSIVTIAACALLAPAMGAVGAFLGVLLATLLNTVMIEHRFHTLVPGAPTTLDLLRTMRMRVTAGVLLLVGGTATCVGTRSVVALAVAMAIVSAMIALQAWREPITRSILQRFRKPAAGAAAAPGA